MPVQKISEHCLQIRRFNVMNCYLVREDDGLTIVDTAMGAARIVVEGARHFRLPIQRILLTHAHVDHVGSLDAIKKLAPKAEVIAGAREAKLLEEAARGVKKEQMALLPGEPQTPIKGGFKKIEHLPSRLVKESDRVGSLRVIPTPGHTPGHLAFLDERDGTLYAGDALFTFGGVRVPFDPYWLFPLGPSVTWHFPTALASGRAIAALNPKRILAGHGPVIENPATALADALARGERILSSSKAS